MEKQICKFCGRTFEVTDNRCAVCAAKLARGAKLTINYADRVRELEEEGMTTSDAQGVADAEIAKAARVQNKFTVKRKASVKALEAKLQEEFEASEEYEFATPNNFSEVEADYFRHAAALAQQKLIDVSQATHDILEALIPST